MPRGGAVGEGGASVRYCSAMTDEPSACYQIVARVRVASVDALPMDKPLLGGWGPIIGHKNLFYAGLLAKDNAPIPPGGEGEVSISVIAPEVGCVFAFGDEIELRWSPRGILAVGSIVSVTELRPHS